MRFVRRKANIRGGNWASRCKFYGVSVDQVFEVSGLKGSYIVNIHDSSGFYWSSDLGYFEEVNPPITKSLEDYG